MNRFTNNGNPKRLLDLTNDSRRRNPANPINWIIRIKRRHHYGFYVLNKQAANGAICETKCKEKKRIVRTKLNGKIQGLVETINLCFLIQVCLKTI